MLNLAKEYKAGVYLRISKEDKEKKNSLLSDLMATSNLEEVVEPIKEEEISKPLKEDIDKSFYTKSMDLKSDDFFDDDENKKEPVIFNILRVVLSLILIVAVGFAVYYIVTNF